MSSPNRILVIDDDPEICDVLERFLSERGYEVKTASDGKEGLAAIQRDPPDVVLLDMQLPQTSGLDVLRKARMAGVDVPVIGISGHPAAEKYLGPDSLKLGAIDFIIKPFDLEYLETTLIDALQSLGAE